MQSKKEKLVDQKMKAAKEKLAKLIKECLKGKDINKIIGEKQ